MRERNARVGGDAEGRGDSGDHFKGEAGEREGFGFLAAAAEDKRVAAFETDDIEALPAAFHEEIADFLLGHGMIRLLFADVDAFGRGGREVEEFGAGEMVVEDAVGLFQKTAAFEGKEFRIARAGPDQVNLFHS